MSRYSIYISTAPYMEQWLKSEYWDEESSRVVFPKGSAENIIMELYLVKTPLSGPALRQQGEFAVAIPDNQAKRPQTYNHLPKAAYKMLLSTIRKRFKKMMWDELHRIRKEDIKVTDLIYAFMEAHGIEGSETNFIAIRQMYLRMRSVYVKKQ